MSDFPNIAFAPPSNIISTCGIYSMAGQGVVHAASTATTGGTWPAANRAIYVAVQIERPVTVFQMSFQVATQSGNYDIGIYSEQGKRLVSKTSTTVPAAGIAIVDITDTALDPGTYFLALNVDNTTASIFRSSGVGAEVLRTCGVQQQAVGAVTLPDPATFANPASSYLPLINAHCVATV